MLVRFVGWFVWKIKKCGVAQQVLQSKHFKLQLNRKGYNNRQLDAYNNLEIRKHKNLSQNQTGKNNIQQNEKHSMQHESKFKYQSVHLDATFP